MINNESFEYTDYYSGFDYKENMNNPNNYNPSEYEDKTHHDFSIVSSNISNISTSTTLNNKKVDFGFWNVLKKNFSEIKNKIKFNIVQNDNLVKFDDLDHIQLFGNKYNLHDINNYINLISYMNKEIIWMSYRSNFEPIVYNNSTYTSDAGWGCMIRAGQMILAKGLYCLEDKNKFSDLLLLFGDNTVRLRNVIEIDYFHYFKQIKDKEIQIDNSKLRLHSQEEYEYIIKNEKVSGKINLNMNMNITPPFSIRNILNSSIKINKGAGDWFSDFDMIKIFSDLNKKYSPIKNLQILHFSDGTIYLNEIIKKCFKLKICNCIDLRVSYGFDKIDFKIKEDEEDDYVIIDNFTPSPYECKCFSNCFYFNNNYYELVNPFFLFVSMRLGLDKIEDIYYNAVLDYFTIHNNLGLIGGKASRALYFVGHSDNKLIFIDPHYVQENVDFFEDKLIQGDRDQTYKPINYYFLELEKMTPCITAGFYCNKFTDFLSLLNDLKNVDSKLIKLSEFKK